METYVLRLSPGDDVRESLERSVSERRVTAGWVLTCVGSLSCATLRYAGHRRGTIISDPLEIVALSGTLSPDGVHLHAACADAEGRVIGGHVLPGCIVRTTVELVIGIDAGLRFRRALDVRTGHSELTVEESEPRALGAAG